MSRKPQLTPGGAGKNSCYMKRKPRAQAFNSGGPGTLGAELEQKNGQPEPAPEINRRTDPGAATPYNALGCTDPVSAKIMATGTQSINTQGWVQAKIAEGDIEGGMAAGQSGTSIFDPVLCELVYRWFCPEGGSILDPFAGGSVRGIVAAILGRNYVGIDLQERQIKANLAQAHAITPTRIPTWIVGDSRDVATLAPGAYDLVFSCPPYFDLERYSDDPADLSTLDYPAFLAAYRAIIAAAMAMLKPDRFAAFVVGDIRDKDGFYRNFVSHTIDAFGAAGGRLYNEAILVTAVGSLPIRVGRQFAGYRKLGKTHQNLVIFYNGDPARIPQEFGEVAIPDLAEQFGEVVS